MGANMLQCGQLYNFIKGIFVENRKFAALVEKMSSDTISLKNRIDIRIQPASFRKA